MSEKGNLISQVLLIAKKNGLTKITPVVLNDAGNLSIHLAPYPIVARIATVLSKEDSDLAYEVLVRELRVARHLQSKDVPVLTPVELADAGPHDVGGIWMTLWRYASPVQIERPSPSEAFELVNVLSIAMKEYPDELPVLGIWERTCQSAARLVKNPDQRVQTLLNIFPRVDEQIRLESGLLIPCHGDAHIGNLLPSPDGWIWTDFEDVSLMPAYWDLASYVCIPALFRGTQAPTLRYVLDHMDSKTDLKAFGLAIIARTLMSTLGNLDYALAGNGDLEFAIQELELAEKFICQIDLIVGESNI